MAEESMGSLLVKIAADTAALRTEMQKAGAEVKNQGDVIKGTMMDVAKAFAIPLSIGATVEAIKSITGRAIEMGESFEHVSLQFDISTEKLSEWDFAAHRTGVSTDELRTGLQLLSSKAVEAINDPMSKAADTLRDFGISADQLKKMDLAGLFETLGKRLNDLPPALRNTDMRELMGRNGAALIAFMTQLDAYAAKAHSSGVIVDDSFVNTAKVYNQTFEMIKDTSTNVGMHILKALNPAGMAIASMDEKAKKAKESISGLAGGSEHGVGSKLGDAVKVDSKKTYEAEQTLANQILQLQATTTDDAIQKADLSYQAKAAALAKEDKLLQGSEINRTRINGELAKAEELNTASHLKQVVDIQRAESRALQDKLNSAATIEASISGDVKQQAWARYDVEHEALIRWRDDQIRTGNDISKVNVAFVKSEKALMDERVKNSRSAAQTQLDDWSHVYNELDKASTQWMTSAADQMATYVMTGKGDFQSLANSIIHDIIRIEIQSQMASALGTSTGGGGLLSGLFGGSSATGAVAGAAIGAAGGGPVASNKPYVVGEEGPELMIPNNSGVVLPTGTSMNTGNGGATVVQNVTVNAGVSQTVRAEIMRMLPMLKDQARDGVLQSIYSGGEMARAVGARS